MRLRKCPGHDDCIIVDDVHTERSKVKDLGSSDEALAEIRRRLDKQQERAAGLVNDARRESISRDDGLSEAVSAVAAGVASSIKEANLRFATIETRISEIADLLTETSAAMRANDRAASGAKVGHLTSALSEVLQKISSLDDAITKTNERIDVERLAREAGDREKE